MPTERARREAEGAAAWGEDGAAAWGEHGAAGWGDYGASGWGKPLHVDSDNYTSILIHVKHESTCDCETVVGPAGPPGMFIF